jgi:ribose/xylose/arabinose/galactoside ABC-type transport system permease subunit
MNRIALILMRRAPWLVAGLIVLVGIALLPEFQRRAYWLSLGDQYFAMAALALALTPIMLTGGIDLSVGSVTVFASVVIGALWRDAGWPIEWAVTAGILAGLLAGLGNGGMVIVGVPSLVATLATRELFRGMALAISGDRPVNRFPAGLGEFWRSSVLWVPIPLIGLTALFVFSYLMIHHTWMGRMIFAIGDNERAARFAAAPVRRIKLGIYAWCGLVGGLCGAATVCRYNAAKADAEKSLELMAIACAVLGGIRIVGGAGHVGGTLVGIVTVAVLMAGLGSIDSTWRDMVTGAVLVGVAVLNEAAARWMVRRGQT